MSSSYKPVLLLSLLDKADTCLTDVVQAFPTFTWSEDTHSSRWNAPRRMAEAERLTEDCFASDGMGKTALE